MTRYLTTLALALAAASILVATPVKAEKVIIYREGQVVDPQDVADVLGKVRTRGIRLLDDGPAAPAAAAAAAPAKATTKVAELSLPTTPVRPAAHKASKAPAAAAPAAPDDSPADAAALSLPVRFAFDSADILPAARAQLDALAKGIKLLSPDSIVTVEGHTDAAGSDAYNLELSRVRANAVRDYLVKQHGIDAARLKAVGYGKSRPLDGADPYAAVNRRVQFRGS
ncbi:OmpA family protein [Variovorax sp. J22R133]|uniref:OmpA family protein n=1 Tax=Variovorax brevis TaxID=3053503 RepID=UPI002577BE1B|nr:OmpA family protein [Variovorax sp. J22R133]MDM0115684.1 OmpA family protein [Variovorax sp. J22R133]